MSENKEENQSMFSKIWHGANYIIGLIALIAICFGAFEMIFGDNEKERLKLANDMLKKAVRIGLELEGLNANDQLVDATASMVKNKNKKECKNSVIYYAFELDNEVIWIKTEKSGDMISAEITEEKHPQDCVSFEMKNGKWEKASNTTSSQVKNSTEDSISRCDDSTLNEPATKLDCVVGGKSVYWETQRELLSYMHGELKYTNWNRICTKDSMARFLITLETTDEESTPKAKENVGLAPNTNNMGCKGIEMMLKDSGKSTDWLVDIKTYQINNLGNKFKSAY